MPTLTAEAPTAIGRPAAATPTEPIRYQRAKNEGIDVGEVRCDAVISNNADVDNAFAGTIGKDEVRAETVDAMVDSGAVRTVIPRSMAARLGLRFLFEQTYNLSDGSRRKLPVYSAIQIEVLGRTHVELPGVAGDEVLLGQTVFEQTGILIDCANQTLVPPPADWAARL